MDFYGFGYKPPKELPSGFFEKLQPLASWIKASLKNAYSAGYFAGRSDTLREAKDDDFPPSAGAIVTPYFS